MLRCCPNRYHFHTMMKCQGRVLWNTTNISYNDTIIIAIINTNISCHYHCYKVFKLPGKLLLSLLLSVLLLLLSIRSGYIILFGVQIEDVKDCCNRQFSSYFLDVIVSRLLLILQETAHPHAGSHGRKIDFSYLLPFFRDFFDRNVSL